MAVRDGGCGWPLAPRGRGCEAMAYVHVRFVDGMRSADGADVSHLAELVRGYSFICKGPFIRPFGAPSPQGEKGRRRPARARCLTPKQRT
jgi:hypothetical protein